MKSINSQKNLLSLSNTALLRIVFEMMVLIHHLYRTSTYCGSVISAVLGPIAVGGFVFLSGYGVGFQFLQKREAYVGRLMRSRVPRIYAILLIANLCYFALYLAIGGGFSNSFSAVISVLYLPVFKGFVALSHWIYFLADLIIYYLLFSSLTFIFRRAKNRLLCTAITILILGLVIIAVLSVINYRTGSSRYLRACLCFPVGLLCAAFNEKLAEIVKKYKLILAIAFAAITVLIKMFLNYVPIEEYVLPIFAVFTLVVLLYGVNTESKAITYLSGLVIYVYVSHEFFLNVLRLLFTGMRHNVLALIVFTCSMLFAIMLNFVVRTVRKHNQLA